MINIYYLDDEPALCEVFKMVFSSDEINITTFTEAEDAITACFSAEPDAIFIDFRLADTTGDVVAEKLSDTLVKYLVTGDLVNTTTYQFKETITKPFDIPYIQSLLNELITN